MNWYKQQKQAGRKLELVWWEPKGRSGRWRGERDGRRRTFKYPNSRAGYEAALQEWFEALNSFDENRPNAKLWLTRKTQLEKVRAWQDQFGDDAELVDDVNKAIEFIEETLTKRELPDSLPIFRWQETAFWDEFIRTESGYATFGSDGWELPAKWEARIEQLERNHKRSSRKPQTVGHWAEKMISFKEAQANGKERSVKTAQDIREKLTKFRNFVGDDSHVKTLDSDCIDDFYRHLLKSKFAGSSKQGYFNAGKRFIKYCWREERCELEELPKKIDDPELTFNKKLDSDGEETKSTIWSPKEFRSIVTELPELWQCYIHLCLNCGFTQTDLDALKPSEIKKGRIIRRRTKTKRNPNPPKVNYKLWDKTAELLEKCRSDNPDHVLLTERGARIAPKYSKEDGTIGSHDNLSRNWQAKRRGLLELKKPVKAAKGKTLKQLRKTGSTTITGNPQIGWVHQIYLGHAASIADKHYNAHDGRVYKPLDEAIAFLGKEFRIK